MSVMIDHHLTRHPKWTMLSDRHRARLIELWCWIGEQDTDGCIPSHIPAFLGMTKKDIERLEEIHWIDRNGSGWIAHDWLDFNPPSDPEERERWFSRRRSRRHREQKRGTKGDSLDA